MKGQESAIQASFNLDIRRYLLMCFSYKWRILSISLLVTLIASFFIMKKPSLYQSTATLLIEAGDIKSGSAADSYSANTGRGEFYSTQFEILKSKEIAELVIHKLNLLESPVFFPKSSNKESEEAQSKWSDSLFQLLNMKTSEKSVNAEEQAELDRKIKMAMLTDIFNRSLFISPKYGTQLVDISFTSLDSLLAADIANAIGQAYIDKEVNARINAIQKASDWLSSKLVELSASLESSEAELQAFREREKIVDVQSAVILINQELSAATEALTVAETNKRKFDAILSMVNTSSIDEDFDLSSLPEITSQNGIQISLTRLQTAQFNLEELSKIYGPKHPKLITSKNEVKTLTNQFKKQINNSISAIKIEAKRSSDLVDKLTKDVQKIRDKYQLVTGVEHEYLRLKRNVDTNRSLFETFFSRSKETAIATDFNFSPARFTGIASPALYPIKSNKKLLVIAAFVLTFGFCLGVILLLEILNGTVKSSKDVEVLLSQRMLGLLPKISLVPEKKKSLISKIISLTSHFLGSIPEISLNDKQHLPLHLFYDESGQKFSESVRTLRSNFMLSFLNKKNQVLEITSSVPGEGKTTVAINLAFSLQKMGKIILVDADLRKPSIGSRFNIPAYHPGLSNLLAGTEALEDCIYVDEVSGLSIIPSGQLPSHPLEILSSDSFAKFIYLLKRSYTHVIIDTPPVYAANDSLIIGQNVDNVLYVVKSDDTRINIVQAGIRRLIEANAKIAGVILNKVDVDAVGHQSEDYNGYYDYYSYSEPGKNKKDMALPKGEVTILS